MAAQTFGTVLLWLIILAIVVVIAVYILRWLYRRSTKETAFVRTGFLRREGGGERRRLRHPRPARDHAGQHERHAHRGAARETVGADHQRTACAST